MLPSSSSSSSMMANICVISIAMTSTIVALLFLSSSSISAQTPPPRQYDVGDGTNVVEWIQASVFDYESEQMIFSTFALNPGAYVAAWNINLPPNPGSTMIVGTGSPGSVSAQASGLSAQVNELSGITLVHRPSDGALIGYYLCEHTSRYCWFVNKLSSYATSIAFGDGTSGTNDGTGTGAQISGTVEGLCYHRNSRKAWVSDTFNHRMRELVWNVGSTAADVTTLVGSTNGATDGIASGAQFTRPFGCAVAYSDEATPSVMFIAEEFTSKLRRLMPVTTTGTVTTIKTMANTNTLNRGLTVHLYESPDKVGVSLFWADTVNSNARVYSVTRAMTLDGASGVEGSSDWNYDEYDIILTTGDFTQNIGLLPNGTVMNFFPGAPSPALKVWQESFLKLGSRTHTISPPYFGPGSPECEPVSSDINTTVGYPNGTIVPVSDSIFDFRSFTPECCESISVPFAENCKDTLMTCTNAVPGVTLWSTLYLLHGTFADDASARNWATSCVANYITCMRNGYNSNPPPADPVCKWPNEAATRLNDPAEAEIFIAAALVGMNRPGVLDVIETVLGGSGGGSSAPVSTTPSPPELGQSESNIVARIPTCAANSQYYCQRNYANAGPGCTCPVSTIGQDVRVRSVFSPLPDSNLALSRMSAADRTCVEEDTIISLCTSRNSNEKFISSFTRDVIEYTANGTAYRIGGSCAAKNPQTDKCTCPFNTTAFEFPLPVLKSGVSGAAAVAAADSQLMRLVTFCLPPGKAAFFEGNQQLDTSAPQCFHPFGTNFSCTCTASGAANSVARRRSVPVSGFVSRFDSQPYPGQITFCDSDQQFPAEIDPAIIGTTIGITIASGAAGGSLDALQAAAIAMTVCANKSGNSSGGGARQMLVFADIDAAGEASGLVFVAVFCFALVGMHWLAAFVVCIILSCRGKPIPDFETGYLQEGPLGELEHTFFDYWEAAVLKVRFPHWSCMLLRIVYAGFAYEASALIGSGEVVFVVVGALGLLLCVIYIVFTYYLTAIWMPSFAGALVITSNPPDVDIDTGDLREEQEQELMLREMMTMEEIQKSNNISESNNNKDKDVAAILTSNVEDGNAGAAAQFGAPRQVYVKSAVETPDEDEDEDGENKTNKGSGGGAQHIEEATPSSPDSTTLATTGNSFSSPTQGNSFNSSAKANGPGSSTDSNNDHNKCTSPLVKNLHGHDGLRPRDAYFPCCGRDDYYNLEDAVEEGLLGERRLVREADNLTVRLPPYFVWYTHAPTLSRLPRCLYWWFIPKGWWTQKRFFNRRYATFYNTYMPRSAWWGPATSRLFMLGISLIRVTDECEFPLLFIGIINILMFLAYMVTMPMRRPAENFLMILQYALAAALAFSRTVSQELSVNIFYALFAIAVVTMVHHGAVQLFEIIFTYDQEMERFHDPNKAFEDTNGDVTLSKGTCRNLKNDDEDNKDKEQQESSSRNKYADAE